MTRLAAETADLVAALAQFVLAEADLDKARLGIERADAVMVEAQADWEVCFRALGAASKRVRALRDDPPVR